MFIKNWDELGQEQHRARQGAILHRFLKEQVLKYSPFYIDLFKSKGLTADDIRTVDDLHKIPFTAKADIAPTRENPEKPRRLVLQPDKDTYVSTISVGKKYSLLQEMVLTGRSIKDQVLDEYLPIFFIATTGRTANPTPFLYSERDLRYFREASRRVFTIAGARRETDFALSAFPYAPHLAFWIVYQGGIVTGTPMFHTGGGRVFGTDRIVPAIQRYGATIVVGIPGYVYHVLRLASERGIDCSKVRLVVLGAERVTVSLKRRLKEMLESMGAKNPVILSTFGFTEARVAWTECPNENSTEVSYGYHLYPDMEIFEIIDPESGHVLSDGESGEVVYTALDWRGSVVLRYRTGDYAKGGITWLKCPGCGRRVARLSTDITRLSDHGELQLSKVKGTLVNFNEFYPILSGHDGVIEWQVEITKRNGDPYELDEIHIYAAVRPDIDRDRLVEELRKVVRERMELDITEVHFLNPDEMAVRLGMDDRPKEMRIVDRRSEFAPKEGGG